MTRRIQQAHSALGDYNSNVRRFFLFLAVILLPSFSGCAQKSSEPAPVSEASNAAPDRPEPPPPAEPTKVTGGDLGYGDDARLFDSAGAALEQVLSEIPQSEQPRVIGFGEYHKLTSSADVQSALKRFADSTFDSLAERSAHLVLETWQVDPSCGATSKEVVRQVEKTIERPPETESELATLLRKARESGTQPHALQFKCDEYKKLLGVQGLDNEALLTTIRTKLEETALKALNAGPVDKMVLVYGGATHNNLFPYKGLEHWSFAESLAKATNNRYLEIDLYVPEFVKDDALLSHEAWYPLLSEARTDQVILIRRDPSSYIVVLRKGFGAKNALAPKDTAK